MAVSGLETPRTPDGVRLRGLNGMTGEVGTLLGPTDVGEWLVIREVLKGGVPGGVRVGYAYPQEIQDVTLGLIEGKTPRSVAEFTMKKRMGL